MPNSQQGISTPAETDKLNHDCVACPFCGLICDDLGVVVSGDRVEVTKNGCARAEAGFGRVIPDAAPQIGGQNVTLDAAITEAARRLKAARLPLFGGLGTDVEGMRALLSLTDKAGGVVDHTLSTAAYRNIGVLQTKGWFMSTLTETRNRADLVIVVGADLATEHPRFFERVVSPDAVMFDALVDKRTVVLIGCGAEAAAGAKGSRVGELIEIDCAPESIAMVLGSLRAAIKGAPLTSPPSSGVTAAQLADLAQRFKDASYGVVVWAPQALTFDGADLAVQIISDIVRDMNKTTRFAGLSLGGNDGVASASSVCSWQSGYPLRVSFASGAPEYDPYRFDIARMLAAGEGDLLVWISSFGAGPSSPPATDLPMIVIATPGIALHKTPDVFIPVGTPGIDHAGRLVRCDSVVSLPLRRLRQGRHPRTQDVASRITAAL
jgi:formylmethanofuran dehydrogenase subunit B